MVHHLFPTNLPLKVKVVSSSLSPFENLVEGSTAPTKNGGVLTIYISPAPHYF